MLLCNLYTLKNYIFCTQLISVYYGQKIKKSFTITQLHVSFFFYNVKNQSTPGAHAVFPVGGAWTKGCATQSLFSENVYKNERVGSYRGYAPENFVISANA